MTRHPGAIFSSFAGSFFGADYQVAHNHDPVIERYVPAIAGLLRQESVPTFHLRYEDLVQAPELWMGNLCDYLEIPYEPQIVGYGIHSNQGAAESGLGDPVGVGKHTEPSTDSIHSWAVEVAGDKQKCQFLESMISALDVRDLQEIGYPLEGFWSPLETTSESRPKVKRQSLLNSYQLKRKIIVKGRRIVSRSRKMRAFIKWIRLACDVMLREY